MVGRRASASSTRSLVGKCGNLRRHADRNEIRPDLSSKLMFDQNGVAVWPALAVNYTTKTQYLFRINKDAFDLGDNAKVNEFVEKRDRPVPFENMVFIGDGSSDIPCFRLVKEQGGLSIAVFKPRTKGARGKANKYTDDGRVHALRRQVHRRRRARSDRQGEHRRRCGEGRPRRAAFAE